MIAFRPRVRSVCHSFFASIVILAVLTSSGEILFQEYGGSPVEAVAAGDAQRGEMPGCPPACSCLCACPCTPGAGTSPVWAMPEWLATPKLNDHDVLSSVIPRSDAPEPHFRPPVA